MKRNSLLNFEKLENKALLSGNYWYVDAIGASNVWNQVSTSNLNNKPVIAIVDSGADLNHPLLKNHLWHNPIDNSVGYDFVQNDNDPSGDFYHGTHVAGIIENVTNGNADLMILRFMDNNGLGYTGAAASAINYATMMKNKGVNVVAINCSFGGILSYSIPLANSVQAASDNGINVILASGNNSDDLDITPRYPGSFNFKNTITVGAINIDSSLASYSNYGKNSVTVGAPGTDIVSSLPNNNYGSVSGTSMATAVVSGEVGLLATLGKYSSAQIKNVIMQGCDVIVEWANKVKCGLINVAKSWNLLKAEKPEYVNNTQSVQSPVNSPAVTISAPVNKITYGLTSINNKVIGGWARSSNNINYAVVKVYVNNILRYVVGAKNYRYSTKSFDAFSINMDKRFFSLKNNLVEVKIFDNNGSNGIMAYKGYLPPR